MSVADPPRSRAGLASTLGDARLRRLYAAEVVSGAGDGVFWVALVVFLDGQPDFALWLTFGVIARLAPRALLSLPAGSLVDRSNLRSLLVTVELLRAALMLSLAVVAVRDGAALVALALVLASYTAGAPTRPALSAVVPTVAGERHLAGANAVLSTVRQIMTFIGPLIGVAIIAASTPAIGFAVNAATFAISALILWSVPGIPDRSGGQAPPASASRRHGFGLVAAFGDGVTVVRSIAALPALVLLIGVMYFVRGAEMVLHVYVVRDQLDAPVEAIGLLAGAVGLGALIGMPLAARAAGSPSPVRPVLMALVATAVPTVLLALATRALWASAVLVFVGIGMVVFEVVIVVMVQRVTPPASLGRVFGAINGAANTGKLVGAVGAPVLVAMLGLGGSLAFVGLAVLAIGAAATWPLVVVGRLAAERQRELAPRVAVLQTLAIFEGTSQQALERIAAEVELVTAGPDTVVIEQGEVADHLYVTIDGSLRATVDGREVGRLSAGDWFGEIGLLDHRPRTATVTTVDDAVLWRIPGDVFLEVLEDAGAPPSALLDGIADRLATHR
jgi:predicted MFS family arabinose efflux permease